VPASAEAPTATVMVEVPAPVNEDGPEVTVTPAGRPVADKQIPGAKALITLLVIDDVPEPF
jgi:hypothetical protein